MCVFQNKLKSLGAILLGGVLLGFLILESAAQSRGNRGIEVEPVASNYSENSAGLFIGINDFAKTNILDLNYAINDAISQAHVFVVELKIIPATNCFLGLSGKLPEPGAPWHQELEALQKAGLDLDSQVFLPTKTEIITKLQRMSGLASAKNDLMVFSVSSHGVEIDREPYFFSQETIYDPVNNLATKETAVTLSTVESYLEKVQSERVLMIYDACRARIDKNYEKSGQSKNVNGVAGRILDSWDVTKGLGLLISCVGDEVSYEEPKFGHGVFTYYFLKSIRGELSQTKGPYLTLGEISEVTAMNVKKWTGNNKERAQTPEYKGPENFRKLQLAYIRNLLPLSERFWLAWEKLKDPLFRSSGISREIYDLYWSLDETSNWNTAKPLIEALEKILPSDPASTQQFIGYWTENKDRWVKKKEEPRPERPLELPVPGKPFQIPSLGLEFVWIPAGSFWMGSPSTETGRDSDEKLHYVQISQGFWMAKYEMTIESFTHFVEETGHVTEAEKNDEGLKGWDGKDFFYVKGQNWRNTLNAGPNYPVVGVSWNDAVAYCK